MSESETVWGDSCGGSGGGEGRSIWKPTMDTLEVLRADQVLCDCVLVSPNGKKFVGHKTVFAACSPFLRALFVHANTETLRHPSEHHLDGLMTEFQLDTNGGLLKMVVEYAYTGKVQEMGFWAVERLLPLADQWNMMGLVGVCVQFLQHHLQLRNCVGIWRFSRIYNCTNLERVSLKFILYHIHQLVWEGQSSEFYGLRSEELEEILKDDLLNLRQEEEVMAVIERWIAINPAERGDLLQRLSQTIRTGLCVNDRDCSESTGGTDKLVETSLTDRTQYKLDTLHLRPRISQDVLLAIGGWTHGSPTGCIESYDCKVNRWFPVQCKDTTPRAYHGLAVVEQKIFMVGGFDGTEYYNNVRSFDPVMAEWKEVAPMHVARCYVSVTVLDGLIYAIGGFDGRDRLSSAEKYDPQRNQWTLIRPMQRTRSDACAAELNGKIYVAGGFNGQEVLRSVEMYNAETDVWTTITDMLSPRSGVTMEVMDEELFVVGGFDGDVRLNNGERYNPNNLTWTLIPSFNTPRSNFASARLNGNLYAIGGFDVTLYGATNDKVQLLYGKKNK